MSHLAERLPEPIFGSIELSYMERINQETTIIEQDYEKKYKQNEQDKKQNLLDLRPNLSNPACKEELATLDKKVIDRFNGFITFIDDTQFKLIGILKTNSQKFFMSILNNTKADIQIYSSLLFNEDYILLPGDDVSQKKHLNIKNLVVQREKEGGYVERTNRGATEKWRGLPKAAFEIDYSSRPEFKKPENPASPPEEKKHEVEMTEEIQSIKTSYHKAMVKQRDESFKRFKAFFDERIAKYFATYDAHRVAEYKFKESWERNVAVLKSKQDIKS